LYVMGRTDDVINVAGHRLSTGSMEEGLAAHPGVAECAVIGVHDALKGQVPRGLVVLKSGVETDPAVLSAELVAMVRERIGAVAALRRVDVVAGLPKTRSGKILRKTMRGIADGADEPVPSTIENADVLDAMSPVLRRSYAVRPNLCLPANASRHPIGWVGRPPLPTSGHPIRGVTMSVRVAAATAALSPALALAMAGS